MNKYKIAIVLALIVIALDQVSKWIVRSSLPLYKNIEILPFFDITHLRNTGAAFGIFRDLPDSLRFPLFAIVLIVAVVVIFIFLKNFYPANPRSTVATLLHLSNRLDLTCLVYTSLSLRTSLSLGVEAL